MAPIPGDTIERLCTTRKFSDGVKVDADSLPTGTVYKNGTANAITVTVTNLETGLYKASAVMASGAGADQFDVGDDWSIEIDATVDSVADQFILDQGTFDSLRNADLNTSISNINTTVQNISSVVRLSTSLVTYMERGVANKAVRVEVALKDLDGNMEDPDGTQLALTVYNVSGTSRDANLYKDAAFVDALDAGSGTFSGYKKMVRSAEGLYVFYYKVEPAATEEELLFKYGWEEGGTALYEFGRSQITDSANDLLAIKAKTDQLNFTGTDVKATLDGEKVGVDSIDAGAVNSIVAGVFAKVLDNTRTFEEVAKLMNAVFRGGWSYDSGTSILTLTYEDGSTLQWDFSTTNQRSTV